MDNEMKQETSTVLIECTGVELKPVSYIEEKILTIRGLQVILDRDIAELYGVGTKRLNEQVKRNSERFPKTFMFRLTPKEYKDLRSQFATFSDKGASKYSPYVFTEQGVAMLSAILRSSMAISVSIRIMEAFVAMRRFIISNESMFQRVQSLELRQIRTDVKVDDILNKLESKDLPIEGIFYDGQIFDAYGFVCDLIRSAKIRVILIDNYIDDTVLKRLDKRGAGVEATVYTHRITPRLQADINAHNAQYAAINVLIANNVHDRFLIIDDTVYHIGASIKDLGKKVFAFSKMNEKSDELLKRL